MIRIGERIELIAIRPIEAASGFLPGLDTTGSVDTQVEGSVEPRTVAS